MRRIILLSNLFLLTLHMYAAVVAITASQFNQLYSCQNPFTLTTTTIVILDEDIVINQCFPFVAGGGFAPTDTLTFTSTVDNILIILPQTVIDTLIFLIEGQPH